MVRQRIENYWKDYRERVVGGSLLLLALLWVYSTVLTQSLPIEATILFVVVFVGISLEIAATDVVDLKESMGLLEEVHEDTTRLKEELEAPPEVFPTVDEANPEFDAAVREHHPDRVYFLEYNGMKVDDIVETALSHNSEVHLLIKDPAEVINSRQRSHVTSTVISLFEQQFDEADNLAIHFYEKPASMKMRKVDDALACVGWYTFEQRPGTTRQNPIWGNDNPMVFVSSDRNPEQFAAVNGWMERIYHARWTSGRTLEQLYYSDDCPDQIDAYGGSDEGSKNEFEDWIERVSLGPDVDRDELFPV